MITSSKQIEDILKKYKNGCVLIGELNVDDYLNESIRALKKLTNEGVGGIYLSFQRPYDNIKPFLEKNGVDTDKIQFIDTVTPSNHSKEHTDCYHISDEIDIDDLIRATYSLLERIDTKDKFIFIDSITTITLYKPLSEVMRFSWFLMDTVKGDETNIALVFNVAKDLAQKKFIQDIAFKADETF